MSKPTGIELDAMLKPALAESRVLATCVRNGWLDKMRSGKVVAYPLTDAGRAALEEAGELG